jgi:hypothetical protein
MKIAGEYVMLNEDEQRRADEAAIPLIAAFAIAGLWARRAEGYEHQVQVLRSSPLRSDLHNVHILMHEGEYLRRMSQQLGDLRLFGS